MISMMSPPNAPFVSPCGSRSSEPEGKMDRAGPQVPDFNCAAACSQAFVAPSVMWPQVKYGFRVQFTSLEVGPAPARVSSAVSCSPVYDYSPSVSSSIHLRTHYDPDTCFKLIFGDSSVPSLTASDRSGGEPSVVPVASSDCFCPHPLTSRCLCEGVSVWFHDEIQRKTP